MLSAERPKRLTNAIKILAVWLLIVFVIELTQVFIYGVPYISHINGHNETLTPQVYIVSLIATIAIQYLLLLGLWWAKNWVRVIYSVLFVLGILGFLYSLTLRPEFTRENLFSLIITTITWLLNAYLMIKLFNKKGSSWFLNAKDTKETKRAL
ncbi:hypothetical protein L3V86_03305 [Thiotrichales bacterium 19S11-10]|nr:hypothetical protein [Thiotrichales bacterium 19S11-10]MCF6806948.1 hypothetical protein [Thiotrichales bacterium 19S9-11]MCF6810917.1 hypothetical protein [Thiotrichales bacterium 19S9-12]